MFRAHARIAILVLFLGLATAMPAAGESTLRLPLPDSLGPIAVETYDEQAAKRVGPAFIGYENLESGVIRFTGSSGIEGAENTVIKADFEVTAGGRLKPLLQESRSRDAQGRPLGVMTIDHRAGTGTCAPTGEKRRSISLPDIDRVANVILAHALVPLAKAGEGEAPFQLLICRPSVRVVSARSVVRVAKGWSEGNLIEIETGLDLGPILNRLLSPWLPSVSIWFDGAESTWLGHRVPLYAKGPTVTVLRADIAEKLASELESP